MEKFIAGLLQVSAGAMLFLAGVVDPPGIVMILLGGGGISGTAALALWGRHSRSEAPPPAIVPPRADLPSAGRIEEMLESLQDEVAQLREEHRFHQELYPAQRKPEQQPR